jgi:hypothetical protein
VHLHLKEIAPLFASREMYEITSTILAGGLLRWIFEVDGFVFRKGKGDHWVGDKSGILRPVVIPAYSQIGLEIIRANMRTGGMVHHQPRPMN